MPLKRPFSVTLLLWMVLSLSAWGAVRFAAALRGWDVLSEYASRLSPVYLSITGAGWALAGGALIWGVLNRKPWTFPAIPAYFLFGLALYWVERLFFQSSRANLPFAVILSLIFLAVTLFCALHRSTKKFITRSEEYGQHNQHSTSA